MMLKEIIFQRATVPPSTGGGEKPATVSSDTPGWIESLFLYLGRVRRAKGIGGELDIDGDIEGRIQDHIEEVIEGIARVIAVGMERAD
jgi:hypothetical protein